MTPRRTPLSQLEQGIPFEQRHIGPDAEAQAKMLAQVGYGSLDELTAAAVPDVIKSADWSSILAPREGRRVGRQAATAGGTRESTALETVSVKAAAVGSGAGEEMREGGREGFVEAFSVGEGWMKPGVRGSIELAFSVGDRVSGQKRGSRDGVQRARFGEGARGELVGAGLHF